MNERLMRRKEVEQVTSLSRSTIYKYMSEGIFPKPVRLGSRVAWKESDIRDWIESREAA